MYGGNMDNRYEIAEQLRNEGKTFRQIGIALKVSPERARQIVLSARRLREYKGIPWLSLSTRTRNRIMYELSCYGYLTNDEFPSPKFVREMINNGTIHKRLPNFGKLSLQELEQWLEEHGA